MNGLLDSVVSVSIGKLVYSVRGEGLVKGAQKRVGTKASG